MQKYIKKILSFLSYHNAVPLAAVVLTMGAGITFAATSTGLLPLPSLVAQPVEAIAPAAIEPDEVDPSALLASNLDAFDFRPTVTAVVETEDAYTVSYSIETLAPEGGAWAAYEKTGEFSVAKNALDDTGLQGYVVAKLRDIENGERTYLARAQTSEKALADARTARPANVFAGLVGLALDQIFVPVVVKPAAPEAPTAPVVPADTSVVTPTPVVETATSADAVNSAASSTVQSSESATSTLESTATSTDQIVQPTENNSATSTPVFSTASTTSEN